MPPPPVVFVQAPGLLSRIREQITAAPDPAVLPWTPLPVYDESAVAIRQRLDRAAREKRDEPPPPPRQAPTRVESSFGNSLPRPGAVPTGASVDFSTAGSFFQKAEVIAPVKKAEPEPEPEKAPSPAPERPSFGIAITGGRPKKKEEDKEEARKRPRAVEDNILQRLKTEFLKGD